MFRFIQLMLCLLASVSAFEMPMSRRGLMSKVAAAAPLAAVLPAFADSDNRMYTLVARPAVEQISGAAPTKAVGTAITVDEVWGSAVGKGKEMSAKDAANYDKGNKGIQVRTHTALHHFFIFRILVWHLALLRSSRLSHHPIAPSSRPQMPAEVRSKAMARLMAK